MLVNLFSLCRGIQTELVHQRLFEILFTGGGTGKRGGGGGSSSDQTPAESWWRPASTVSSSAGISILDPQDDFISAGHGLAQSYPASFGISSNTIGKYSNLC